MTVLRTVQRLAVALATISIALPHCAVAVGAQNGSPRSEQGKLKIADVALAEGGILNGQVVDSQGVGMPGRLVSLQQRGTEVVRTRTDDEGRFAASGLSGGTYLVSTDGVIGPVRAWAPATAPPIASDGLLLVPHTQTVRGQLHLPRGGGLLTNPGFIITAAFVGTIIGVAIEQNSGS
jgi:hypothetical protein